MLKKYIKKQEYNVLFELMQHPDVYPYVRLKASTLEQFVLLMEQIHLAEERGEVICRMIVDEWQQPIGMIHLFDVEHHSGFLGTWIGKEAHGKGYNAKAKEVFLQELFYEREITNVFLRIRLENIRSQKAAEKLPYTIQTDVTRINQFGQRNETTDAYKIYEIPKFLFSTVQSGNRELEREKMFV